MEDRLMQERRSIERRLGDLEQKMNAVLTTVGEFTALKNQISGAVTLIKWVGFAGICLIVASGLHYLNSH